METIPCPNCNTFFTPRNSLQTFCSGPDCQRARKNLWQKQTLATDPEYKEAQDLAQKKWLQNNPDYWKQYRENNPDKTQRNRCLQQVRNLKRNKLQEPSQSLKTVGIAKMDASKASRCGLSGEYWMIPMIAKMDPVKIYITVIPVSSP